MKVAGTVAKADEELTGAMVPFLLCSLKTGNGLRRVRNQCYND